MSENELYQKMYYKLFNAVTDAINAMDKGNNSAARETLVQYQQICEELYISAEAPSDEGAVSEAD